MMSSQLMLETYRYLKDFKHVYLQLEGGTTIHL